MSKKVTSDLNCSSYYLDPATGDNLRLTIINDLEYSKSQYLARKYPALTSQSAISKRI